MKEETMKEETMREKFIHKTFEERLEEYNGEISVIDFDWGEPAGRELL